MFFAGWLFADDKVDPKLRLAEIDKALSLAEQRIRIFSSNAVRNAQLIEAENVKVRALLPEKYQFLQRQLQDAWESSNGAD